MRHASRCLPSRTQPAPWQCSVSDEAVAWRCPPCFCSRLSQEGSRRKRATQKGHGDDLGNWQAFLARAALVGGHSSACCRSPGGKMMHAAGLFPSQTSPGTVPSTIAATGVARTSLETNWDSAAGAGKAKLNSTSKNTLHGWPEAYSWTEKQSFLLFGRFDTSASCAWRSDGREA